MGLMSGLLGFLYAYRLVFNSYHITSQFEVCIIKIRELELRSCGEIHSLIKLDALAETTNFLWLA
jgi:hypothetical protein